MRFFPDEFQVFLGSKVGKDPQNIIDKVKKILGVMQVTGSESVELASYKLNDVANICSLIGNTTWV